MFHLHFLESLVGIFDQIMGDDDSVREKAMDYVNVSLMDMRHKLFIPHEENEKFLVELIRKVRLYIITCTCTCVYEYVIASPFNAHMYMYN